MSLSSIAPPRSQKVELLARRLNHLSACYYNGRPIVSDAEFDSLRDELELINPEHPFLSQVGAPLESLSTAWPKHTHSSLVGSLHKCAPEREDFVQMKQDFMNWAAGKGDKLVLTEKYDGSTVVATYDNGELQCMATRGDGSVGEDITLNASKVKNVPSNVPDNFTGEIRGEAMLTLSDFEKHFKPEGCKNPRNTANGKIREQKDSKFQQYLQVFWFDIIPTDRDLGSETEKWNLLKKLMNIKCTGAALTAEQIWDMYEYYRDGFRDKLNYEIDGLVIKVDDLEEQESFGVTSNKPNGAIALKFPPIKRTTKLENVVWQQGLTGRIHPVAILSPIDLGGVTVRRASLCNMGEINRLGIAIGDEVLVSRRNDVIPKVEKLVTEAIDRVKIVPPEMWEGDPIVEDGAYLVTMNLDSQGHIFGNLMTWVKTMKLKGFGPSVIRGLIDEGVTSPLDFYEANQDVFQLACNSEKNGKKLHEKKEASRETRLGPFLAGLNISSLGNTNGRRLEKHFGTLKAVMTASIEDFAKVPGIKTNASKIHEGLHRLSGLVDDLSDAVVVLALEDSGELAGTSVCVTGNLSVPRGKFKEWIQNLGGELKSGVSSGLTYLVTNDPNSGTGKNKKADQLGVAKLTEEQFYEKIGRSPKGA